MCDNVLVAFSFFDFADEGAEPVIAYYSSMQYQGDDVVLLSVVNASPTVPTIIFVDERRGLGSLLRYSRRFQPLWIYLAGHTLK